LFLESVLSVYTSKKILRGSWLYLGIRF